MSVDLINQSVNAIVQAPAPLWMKLLAIAGGMWLVQTAFHTGVNIVYFFAYVYGFVKWLMGRNK